MAQAGGQTILLFAYINYYIFTDGSTNSFFILAELLFQ